MPESDRKPGYYAIIPADVRYDEQLTANAKLLYGELTALADSRGYCWATNQYFADLYGLSIKTISRLIRELETRGYIRTEMATIATGNERRIYSGAFMVIEGGMYKNVQTPSRRKVQGGIDNNVQPPLPKNVQRGMDKNVQLYNKNNTGEYNTPLPPDLKKRVAEYCGDNEALLSALLSFAELRKKKRKPILTDRQLTLLFNRLDKLSEGRPGLCVLLLDKAVLRGWDSIYPLKPDELAEIPSSDSPHRTASAQEAVQEW